MSAFELFSVLASTLGLLGGTVAFFTSRASARATAEAQERIARVLEAANAPPPLVVRWRLHGAGQDRYRLTNTGNLTAEQVKVRAWPGELSNLVSAEEQPDIEAADGYTFSAMRRLGVTVREIEVTWNDASSGHQSKRLRFP